MTEERGAGAFAGTLRRLRESRSLTQEELAERAGVTAKAIGALERGERRRPYPHTVRALADALRLDDEERAALVSAVPGRRQSSDPRTASAPGGGETGAARTAAAVVSPPFPTTTVGRESDVAAVLAHVASGARLVTLTGPGGVGKTRLAREVLGSAADGRDGPAVFVDLAPVREASAVLPRLAAALGLPDAPGGRSPQGLAAALTGRRVTAVLDNLEQVLTAAPLLAELVALTPDLVVIATSRAPLRVRAEREVPVLPLALPAGDAVDEVARSPAVQMFLDRAAASGVAVELTSQTAPVIAAISRRLDGIPLALELAAAATRLLPPAALLGRLDEHGLDLAVGGPRDLPDRQRTMTAVLDWSVELLDPLDAALLGRLATFSGGFSLGSVEAVAHVPTGDVIGPLARLVEQSLVTPTPPPDGEPRFRLLEPVRQYALARLRGDGEAVAAADAHAGHFHDRAVAAHRRLQQRDVGPVLDRLEADHANFRSALLRLLELDRLRDAAELVGALWLYLGIRGRVREGLAWLDLVAGAGSDPALAWAGVGRMGLLLVVGDVAGMGREASVAVPAAERSGDPLLATEASALAGLAAAFSGDEEGAARLLGARPGLDDEEAGWISVHRRIGRGQAAMVGGRPEAALRLLDAAVEDARALGNEFTLATALNTAATLAEMRGDDAAAARLLGEALELSVAHRLSWSLGYSLPALAGVAGRVGDPVVAATLFGAAATLTASDAVDAHFPPSRETADRGLAAARDALGEAAFRSAWEAGRSADRARVPELAAAVVDQVGGQEPRTRAT